jgi:hypothetical protein
MYHISKTPYPPRALLRLYWVRDLPIVLLRHVKVSTCTVDASITWVERLIMFLASIDFLDSYAPSVRQISTALCASHCATLVSDSRSVISCLATILNPSQAKVSQRSSCH